MSYITFPDISPDLFTITIGGFHFALRWYALAYIAGILAAWRIMVFLVRRQSLWGGADHCVRGANRKFDILVDLRDHHWGALGLCTILPAHILFKQPRRNFEGLARRHGLSWRIFGCGCCSYCL